MIDGENGAKIQRSVRGSGPYTFSGSIQATSTQNEPVTLTITNGVINADKLKGTATLSVFTPQLAGVFESGVGGCTVTVVGENVKGGVLWAMFACPSITSPSTAQACSVGSVSAIVLENCAGS